MSTGLNTSLKLAFGINTEKHVSDSIKGFLNSGGKNPPQGGFQMPTLWTPEQVNKRNLRSSSYIEKSGSIYVPTDKTNSTREINIEDYRRLVSDILSKAANLALRPNVVALFEDANKLFDKVKKEFSVQESNFLRQ